MSINRILDKGQFDNNEWLGKTRCSRTQFSLGILLALLFFINALYFVISKIEREKKDQEASKQRLYIRFYEMYINNLVHNKKIESYFKDRNVREIAVYGGGILGQLLYSELRYTGISIKYLIDRNDSVHIGNLKTVSPEDVKGDVDMIVVTPIYCFDEIYSDLENRVSTPIVSLEEVNNLI